MNTLSWHQQRAAGLHALPYDVVGYVFRADTLCPACTVAALPTGPSEPFDGWALAPGADLMAPEDELREIAQAFGIDVDDETTYDSDDFPKVLFRDQTSENGNQCGGCGADLT